MSSLPSAEDVRLSAGPSPTSRCSKVRRCLPCIGCLALLALIIGLSVGLTKKDPVTLAMDTYEDIEEYFGGGQRDDPTEEDRGSVSVTSPTGGFEYGAPLPAEFTVDGADVNPELRWTNLPEGTESIAVFMEDHDYPHPDRPLSKPWVHWVVYDVNPLLAGLPEALPGGQSLADVENVGTGETVTAGAGAGGQLHQGATSWGNDSGYRGPDPPAGHPPHRYYFRVLALDDTVEDKLPGGGSGGETATYEQILEVVEGDNAKVKVLGFGLLMGTYQKA
eukprot:CAMPEP_0197464756 /NCGR_PEP_ID=MMETSP1175-20131217/64188_1 /TAXON_ID=1003142 /ORGANISM="Triceratium dubium, Strain CCMP147" /LENGTH=276 /DNA_ID=CAMNT_0043000747 /DNA_START=377 /DNA_END=1207 /DNA_ORIENTATION=-